MAQYKIGAMEITEKIYRLLRSQQGEILRLSRTSVMREKEVKGFVGELDLFLQTVLCDFLPSLIDCKIVSEEIKSAWPPVSSDFWIIDPLDGTDNSGMLSFNFGTMGALIERGGISLAWIYLPIREQVFGDGFFFAVRGNGAFQKTPIGFKPLHVSDKRDFEKANVFLEGESKKLPESPFICKIRQNTRNRNGMSCALSFALLASGFHAPIPVDAVISYKNEPWDNLPGILLTEEAGGKVTDFYGRPWSLENCGSLVFSNGLLHGQIIALNCPAFR
ncbi:hypothetical protein A3B05_00855 [Candidatus Giovannonibacteria bacterium RIFCSPLOWO2_01_FULL_43_160]|uniref:Inositol-1-monophosphatase n=2 Tax=Candidatus Giovannoniibacteriota TaxID=1752738 RepID=A0A0G1IXH0_9BACT|nr:MAG: Inositol-1-monophosphatase [Candidatus Giovannonibacteria bacterium GW2011_GWB1_43_13]KKS99690.1 MAG: Inositol-1-monophosphatase [Candidatus Giovannonibacteria bacterium GW2011_GWA1_43_15]KKT20776.1 MAG: Inositol-1-monophosphatase [Candidatus Giovannonibacteria bacterium GW2011_GWC2_43_8]KKT63775.1 MAG: Inositol-1-monophosphatase [Candidatus Giovannonibacteria bacterium GW2011_GWA2_44_26]OGF58251.1 MAG: hypothetical protein A2652_00155 [Candidatus Giovannonibacteria bacterium RIFCSPHIGH